MMLRLVGKRTISTLLSRNNGALLSSSCIRFKQTIASRRVEFDPKIRAERSKIIRAKIDAAENTTVYFNTCIADAVRNLDLDLVKYAFNQMKLENIPPSEETYALLIGSCLIDYNAERALFYAEHMTNSPYINYLSPRLLQIVATIFKEVKFEEGEKIISELAAKEEITKQELRLALAKIRGHPRFKPTKEFVLK